MADPRLRDPVVGAVTVPIYETSSAEQVRFVLHDSGRCWSFAETDAHADKIEQLDSELPRLRKVLRIDGSGTRRWTSWPRRASPSTRRTRRPAGGIKSADPATLIYTSGTTGRPKGCQLTHSNLLYEIRGAKAASRRCWTRASGCWCSCRWRTCWPARSRMAASPTR
jgi:long-chain acyl-CoA synthetase